MTPVTSSHFSGLVLAYMLAFESIALDPLKHGLCWTISITKKIHYYTISAILTLQCRWQSTFINSKTNTLIKAI